MSWKTHARRLVVEILIFLIVFTAAVYFMTDQESFWSALGLGAIAAVIYAGATYMLRSRVLNQPRENR